MLLGLLVAGIGVGAVVAALWVATGGSLLAALGLYAASGVIVVLAAALRAVLAPDRDPSPAPDREEPIPAAE